MKKKAEATQNTAEVGIKTVNLVLRGRPESPLVIHAFAEKAKQEIRDKQQKKAKKAKEERRPLEECEAAKYYNNRAESVLPLRR